MKAQTLIIAAVVGVAMLAFFGESLLNVIFDNAGGTLVVVAAILTLAYLLAPDRTTASVVDYIPGEENKTTVEGLGRGFAIVAIITAVGGAAAWFNAPWIVYVGIALCALAAFVAQLSDKAAESMKAGYEARLTKKTTRTTEVETEGPAAPRTPRQHASPRVGEPVANAPLVTT